MTTETTETTETTFKIPATRESYLAHRIGELAARAAKLSLTVAIGFEVLRRFDAGTGAFYRDAETGERVEETRPMVEVRVFGEAPRLQGWALRGRFDFGAIPGETMRAMVPGFECPVEFHNVDPRRCDACKAERERTDTFLLEHEDGRLVVVGRTCLRDYLGHVDPEHVARMAQYLTEVSEAADESGAFWGGFEPDVWDLGTVLDAAAYSVRTLGWAKADWASSTKGDVYGLLAPCKDGRAERARLKRLAEISDVDRTKAAHVAKWIGEADASGDYMDNLRAIGRAGLVTSKALGLAVSAIVAFDRAMEREVSRRERNARKGDSDFVGTLKRREVFTGLRCEMIRGWGTAYGYTTLYKFCDSNSNVFTWKCSGSADIDVGDVLDIRGTVKAHEEYRGEKQTVLTRCKVEARAVDGPARSEQPRLFA